ncbi:MAG TPA: START domain-containing protein [Deltaproteobacteria bacterium]|nr:START domain-containing protein [Deltaproteobacteria bacterium]
MKSCCLLVMLVSLIASAQLYADEISQGWKKAKHGEGIQVYTRPSKDSPSDEFLGVTDVDAPLKVILEVFRDIPSFPQWYGFCRDIRLINRMSDTHEVIYFILATPWPVKDRDMVVDVLIEKQEEKGVAVISMNALKEEIVPVQENYVRMTRLIGKATLTERGDGKTHVTYMVNSDPAGYIPAAISNMLAKDQPYLTLKGLKEMVKNDKYYELAGIEREKP